MEREEKRQRQVERRQQAREETKRLRAEAARIRKELKETKAKQRADQIQAKYSLTTQQYNRYTPNQLGIVDRFQKRVGINVPADAALKLSERIREANQGTLPKDETKFNNLLLKYLPRLRGDYKQGSREAYLIERMRRDAQAQVQPERTRKAQETRQRKKQQAEKAETAKKEAERKAAAEKRRGIRLEVKRQKLRQDGMTLALQGKKAEGQKLFDKANALGRQVDAIVEQYGPLY